MEPKIQFFCHTLQSISVHDSEFINQLYEAIDILEGVPDISPSYKVIFSFIEQNAAVDLGSPGPLVHLLEEHYPTYIEPLLKSIKAKPTYTTVLMLNRLLNSGLSVNGDHTGEYNIYYTLLVNIARNENTDSIPKELAKELLRHQQNDGA